MHLLRTLLTSITFVLVLAACGGGASSGGTGAMNLSVTDAPVDGASKIVVAFTGIELQHAEGERLYFHIPPEPNGEPRSIDLLDFQNGLSAPLLEGVGLPAGHYNWIRLIVADKGSYLEDAQGVHELRIPSGAQSGLKLNRGFNVAVDETVDFTIDFDLRNSVHYHSPDGLDGDYMLRPTLRLVDNLQVGAIAGTIDLALTDAGACGPGNSVYVFAGPRITPDDVDGVGVEPLTSALAYLDAKDGICRYHVAFLPAGEYTVAFTAKAAYDDPALDEPAVVFVGTTTVSVEAGRTTTHNFTL